MPKKAKPPLTENQRKQLALVFDYVPRWMVAMILHVDVSTLSRWLSGKSSPPDVAALIAATEKAARTQSEAAHRAIDNLVLAWLADTTTPAAGSHANQQPGDGV